MARRQAPQACEERWARARRVVGDFYPDLPGIDDVPADHTKAGLPEAAMPW